MKESILSACDLGEVDPSGRSLRGAAEGVHSREQGKSTMLGAIAGDIIGSVYEALPIKTTHFRLFHPRCRFTDDTVLTVALADSLMHGPPFVGLLKQYYRAYPHAGYGGSFHQWAQSEDSRPYNSWGNGSAIRVSPVGFAFDSLEEVLDRPSGAHRLRTT